MTEDQIQQQKAFIDQMSHEEMAKLYRFAPVGHPFFDVSSPLHNYFMNRFRAFGGMTLEISKKIGW